MPAGKGKWFSLQWRRTVAGVSLVVGGPANRLVAKPPFRLESAAELIVLNAIVR